MTGGSLARMLSPPGASTASTVGVSSNVPISTATSVQQQQQQQQPMSGIQALAAAAAATQKINTTFQAATPGLRLVQQPMQGTGVPLKMTGTTAGTV